MSVNGVVTAPVSGLTYRSASWLQGGNEEAWQNGGPGQGRGGECGERAIVARARDETQRAQGKGDYCGNEDPPGDGGEEEGVT